MLWMALVGHSFRKNWPKNVIDVVELCAMKVEQVLAAIAEVSFDDIDLNKDGVITPEEL